MADERQVLFKKLQSIIFRLYPTANIRLSYKIPTYRIKSGWIALGYWKSGVSVYTDSPDHIAHFKEAHPTVKTGKASINFKVIDEIPVDAVESVIKHAMEN
ncbi:MAG: DUF1801 domain-containing protein [Promethearchaeota archaeon]